MAGHFHLGELVEIIEGAPAPLDAGKIGTVAAILKVDSAELVFRHGVPFGSTLFTVEFADGSEADVSGEWLRPAEQDPEDAGSDPGFKILN